MGTELKPCHCGRKVETIHGVLPVGDLVDACMGCGFPPRDRATKLQFDRGAFCGCEPLRTPDLTEALARLKALGEEMRQPQTVQRGASAFGIEWTVAPWLAKWAKEIAAIRKALGASASEPTSAPEP